jgi:hypothetical protein
MVANHPETSKINEAKVRMWCLGRHRMVGSAFNMPYCLLLLIGLRIGSLEPHETVSCCNVSLVPGITQRVEYESHCSTARIPPATVFVDDDDYNCEINHPFITSGFMLRAFNLYSQLTVK